jgi:hypothetical protein
MLLGLLSRRDGLGELADPAGVVVSKAAANAGHSRGKIFGCGAIDGLPLINEGIELGFGDVPRVRHEPNVRSTHGPCRGVASPTLPVPRHLAA